MHPVLLIKTYFNAQKNLREIDILHEEFFFLSFQRKPILRKLLEGIKALSQEI